MPKVAKEKRNNLIIDEVMSRYGVSRKDITDRLGISNSTVSVHANGNPSVRILSQFADAIGCDIREFFQPEDSDMVLIRLPKCSKIEHVERDVFGNVFIKSLKEDPVLSTNDSMSPHPSDDSSSAHPSDDSSSSHHSDESPSAYHFDEEPSSLFVNEQTESSPIKEDSVGTLFRCPDCGAEYLVEVSTRVRRLSE